MRSSTLTVTLAVLGLAGVFASGCKGKSADASAAPASSTQVSSADTKAAASAVKDMSVDQFVGKAVPAACKTITSCKNDKVKVAASTPLMMIASFGTIDKPDLQKDLKAVDGTMKADKRFTPNENECVALGTLALKVLGVNGDALKDRVGKTIAYDAQKAGACIEAISKAPEACGTEVKLASEPKFSEIDAFTKDLKPQLDGFGKPCEDVITGLVEAGGACELDVECKGKGAKCKAAKGTKATGKAKAKDTAAAAKTCQAGH